MGDPTALPSLLGQIDADVTQFIADGAYDGDPTSDLLVERFDTTVEIIIPPPKNAVFSPDADDNPTLRHQRIAAIPDNRFWFECGRDAARLNNGRQDTPPDRQCPHIQNTDPAAYLCEPGKRRVPPAANPPAYNRRQPPPNQHWTMQNKRTQLSPKIDGGLGASDRSMAMPLATSMASITQGLLWGCRRIRSKQTTSSSV
jgi:hypothetical protein